MHKSPGVFVVVAVVLGCCCFCLFVVLGGGHAFAIRETKRVKRGHGSDSFAVELTRRVFFLFQYHTTPPHGM